MDASPPPISSVGSSASDAWPVAIIGAGPVGLAAAAQLQRRGQEFLVLEAGGQAGAAVSGWGHTRLFSPWEYVIDEAAADLLSITDWEPPPAKTLPTGREFVERYLLPLAAHPALAPRIHYYHRVLALTRQGMDRTRSHDREEAPFVLRTETADGITEVTARAVVDASGTFDTGNSICSNGLAPLGMDDHLCPALPDVLGADRDRFVGRRVLVVGAGHSAAHTLLKLAVLARQDPGTHMVWAIRGEGPVRVYGSSKDELAARGELGAKIRELVSAGVLPILNRFEIETLAPAPAGGVQVAGRRSGHLESVDVDVVVNATGFRPNLDMLRELRLDLDSVLDAPRALAPLIDPNVHSCGTVEPHGVAELAHPEPGFFIAGMKSYGRAPSFLLLTGYEQVRSIADELSGNREKARRVTLVLPGTGVCSTGPGQGFDPVSSSPRPDDGDPSGTCCV